MLKKKNPIPILLRKSLPISAYENPTYSEKFFTII